MKNFCTKAIEFSIVNYLIQGGLQTPKVLREEHFSDSAMRSIFKFVESGSPVTVELLRAFADENGLVTVVEFLLDLKTVSSLDDLVSNLIAARRREELKSRLASLLKSIKLSSPGFPHLLGELRDLVVEFGSEQSETCQDLSEALSVRVDNFLLGREENLDSVKTGFPIIDLRYPMTNGELIIIAARPAIGKTALALSLIKAIACRGISVGLFSLEMGVAQISDRFLSMLSKTPIYLLSKKETQDILSKCKLEFGNIKVYVDDQAQLSADEIFMRGQKMVTEKGVKIIFVDYLQLLRGDGGNRNLEIAHITGTLKALAKTCNVPVIALSQLSRDIEKRKFLNTKEPVMPVLSDLRDGGSIEQDADKIFFLQREDCAAKLTIGKNRQGAIGSVPLFFAKIFMEFRENNG